MILKKINTILFSIKYKSLNDIRIKTTDRLTKYNTAKRFIYKLKYKSNIGKKDFLFK